MSHDHIEVILKVKEIAGLQISASPSATLNLLKGVVKHDNIATGSG